MSRTYRASVHVGRRTFSELLDMKKEKESYDESIEDGYEKPDWETYTRPVIVHGETGYDQLKDHILYSWLEYLFQSDISPVFCLTEFNNSTEWSYQFE